MKHKTIFAFAAAACLLASVLSLTLGAAALSLPELVQAIASGTGTTAGRIFYFARLPRTCACLLSGAALAAAGCVIQGVLANSLASPGIIGVNAGAGLAVTVCCALPRGGPRRPLHRAGATAGPAAYRQSRAPRLYQDARAATGVSVARGAASASICGALAGSPGSTGVAGPSEAGSGMVA